MTIFLQEVTDRGPRAKQLSIRRRQEWLSNINKKNWVPTSSSYVCSIHFVGNVAADLLDDTNPAWVPSVLMGYSTKEGDLGRYNRCKRRSEQQDSSNVKRTTSSNILLGKDNRTPSQSHRSDDETPSLTMNELSHPTAETVSEDVCRNETTGPYMDEIHLPMVTEVSMPLQTEELDIIVNRERENETRSLRLDNQNLRDELTGLKSRKNILTIELFKNNQNVLQFYTALPNWTIFKAVFDLVSPSLPISPNSKLSAFQMITMFLMNLRLNLFDEDIGYRFSVHRTTVSRNFHKVLDVMDTKLSHLIKWPDRQTPYPLAFEDFLINVL